MTEATATISKREDHPSLAELEHATGTMIGLPGYWDPEFASGVREVMVECIQGALDIDKLRLGGLKYLVIASDFASTVAQYQRTLERRVGVTDNGGALAVGKTLSWRGSDGEDYGLVVISERISGGIRERMPLARAIVHHELAHVHDDWKRNDLSSPPPDVWDLPGVRAALFQMIWSEYFAERTASRHYGAPEFETHAGNHTLIAEQDTIIRRRAWAYRLHAMGLRPFWSNVVSAASMTLGVLGRCLGALHAEAANDAREKFLGELGASWRSLAVAIEQPLADLHRSNYDWSEEEMDGTVSALDGIWDCFGVFPRSQEGGELYVDIPFNRRRRDPPSASSR